MPISYSHADFFTRNIGTVIGGSTSSTAVIPASSNAAPYHWPTADDVAEWAQAAGHPLVSGSDSTKVRALQVATDAAVSHVAWLKGLCVRPVDADGAVIPELDGNGDPNPEWAPVEIDPRVHQATLLLAARLYRRKDTPDGAYGAAELSGSLKTSKLDDDIEMLLYDGPSL